MIGTTSSRTIPPLSPAIQGLLAYERDVVAQPEIVAARALARAREALHAQEALSFAPPRRAPRPIFRLAFAAAAGMVLMAGAAAAYQMLRSPHSASQPPAPRIAPKPSFVTTPAWEPPSPTPAEPVPLTAPPKVSSAVRGASQAELRFLVRARQADARGDYAKVLSLLAQHQRGYPVGRLAEEREVLRVKALVGLGRQGKARQVAADFRHHFPRSVLLPKVDEMLASSR
jgi:hypothetical protein